MNHVPVPSRSKCELYRLFSQSRVVSNVNNHGTKKKTTKIGMAISFKIVSRNVQRQNAKFVAQSGAKIFGSQSGALVPTAEFVGLWSQSGALVPTVES